MIEIVFGKKIPAIILKVEDLKDLKQELRKSEDPLKKLPLSKTGEFASGKLIDKFEISEIKKYLKNTELAQKSENKNLKKFFPKKRKKADFASQNPPKTKSGQAEISQLLSFEKIINRPKTYHSEMQELVDEIRKYFNEVAVRGEGSFSYYIGFFKKIPISEIKRFFAEVKQTKKSTFDKKKLFWWKIGQFLKKKSTDVL